MYGCGNSINRRQRRGWAQSCHQGSFKVKTAKEAHGKDTAGPPRQDGDQQKSPPDIFGGLPVFELRRGQPRRSRMQERHHQFHAIEARFRPELSTMPRVFPVVDLVRTGPIKYFIFPTSKCLRRAGRHTALAGISRIICNTASEGVPAARRKRKYRLLNHRCAPRFGRLLIIALSEFAARSGLDEADPGTHPGASGQGLCPRRGISSFRPLRSLPSRVMPRRISPFRRRGPAPRSGRIEAPLGRPPKRKGIP
jgi:hypothetical protein